MARKKQKKQLSDSFAFVVDGDTEKWYLSLMRQHESLPMTIKPELAENTLKRQYEQVIDLAQSNSKVFWIVDYDVIRRNTNQQDKSKDTDEQIFRKYYDKLENKDNVIVIVNNPCLEFWYLLHFKYTNKFFSTCKDVEKELHKIPTLADYEKTEEYYKQKNNIYKRLKEKLETAFDNSNRLNGFIDDPNQLGMNRAICEMCLLFDDSDIGKHIGLATSARQQIEMNDMNYLYWSFINQNEINGINLYSKTLTTKIICKKYY